MDGRSSSEFAGYTASSERGGTGVLLPAAAAIDSEGTRATAWGPETARDPSRCGGTAIGRAAAAVRTGEASAPTTNDGVSASPTGAAAAATPGRPRCTAGVSSAGRGIFRCGSGGVVRRAPAAARTVPSSATGTGSAQSARVDECKSGADKVACNDDTGGNAVASGQLASRVSAPHVHIAATAPASLFVAVAGPSNAQCGP